MLPLTSGLISALAVPIVVCMFVCVVYYNYFVLHNSTAQRIASGVSGALGSGISFVASGIGKLFKNGNEEAKKVPELIAVEDLQTEIGNIEKSLTTNGETESVKNRIKELKSRIYATRGVFSDHNLKSLRSYTNSLKYYVTTGILFRSTRHRYNELENQLSALESSVETISKIVEFNNTLQNCLEENKNGNLFLTFDDLLGNDGKGEGLYIGFTKALSNIKELKTNKSLEEFAQECRNEICQNYINLIEKVAFKEANEALSKSNEDYVKKVVNAKN